MSTVRQIVSEAKHSEGLTQWKTAVLDLSGRDLNVPEWLRRVRTWLELHAIDGTASGLSVVPFVEPSAAYPEETGPNSWHPINPSTGAPAVLEPSILTKLKATKFTSYSTVQVNLTNQARIIFQVILNSALSRQSQAAVKNSPEWTALQVNLNKWAELLSVIVRLHTVQRGADVEESRIVAKFRFETKLRSFKQIATVDSGAHLERFDDLILEGKTIGLVLDQKELAYLLVNSMKLPASRNKRTLLMELGQATPSSYAVAKAFVLEAEAMSRSINEFNGTYSNGGHTVITEVSDLTGNTDKELNESDEVNLVTAGHKGPKHVYSALQKQQWKKLSESERKKVIALEEMTDRIRGGEIVNFDLRSATSSLTTNTEYVRHCWKCGDESHVAKDCPKKDSIKDLPLAPPQYQKKKFQRARVDDKQKGEKGGTKKVEFAAIAEAGSEEESSEEDYYHLDTLLTEVNSPNRARSTTNSEGAMDPALFLDESYSDDEDLGAGCMVTEEERCLTGRLELEIKKLNKATRLPTDEDIALQADLIGCPQYCKGLGETVLVEGVQVIKGGPFDTTGGKQVVLRWGIQDSGSRETPEGQGDEEDSGGNLLQAIEASGSKAIIWNSVGGQGQLKRFGTPTSSRGSVSLTSCEECAKLKELMHVKCHDMHRNCAELMEIMKTEFRVQMVDLRAEEERKIKQLEEVLGQTREELGRTEEALRETKTGDSAGEKAQEMKVDRLSSSLAHAIERNSALAEALEHASATAERERGQCEFYRKTMQSDRLEMKSLQRQLGERQKEEDERVEVYRESCRMARETIENLRKSEGERVRNERAQEPSDATLASMNERKRARNENEGRKTKEGDDPKDDAQRNAKTPPIFDPSTQRSITPIFGQTAQAEEAANQSGDDSRVEVLVSSNASETEEASAKSKKTKKIQRELAKLANANGINVDEYGKQRKGRYEAEQEARKERQNLKLLSFVLWECEQSVELRARLRDTEFTISDVEERERGYKAILNGIGGPAEYMKFLNLQSYDVKRQKITMEWAAELVERYRLHPEEKPKPVKLQMREKDPAELTRWQESIRLIKASNYPKEKEKLLIQMQTRGAQDEENEEVATRYAKLDIHRKKEKKGEEDDEPPPLIDDSDDSDDETETGSKPKGSGKQEATLATHEGETNGENNELTIHDHLVLTLDNAASAHVFRDPELVHSVTLMKGEGVSIGGLKSGGERVVCREKGMFLSVTGVLIGRDSIANLLSQGTLVDQGHRVEYDTESDVYAVKFKGTEVSLTFRRQKRAETATMRKH